MAADKALIAGAAKVAGAQAKVDYATTKAFTDLGEDIEEQVQLNLKNLQEQEEANSTFQTKQYESVASSVPVVPEGLINTPFETGVRSNVETYATYGRDSVLGTKAGSQTFDEKLLTDPKLQEFRKNMETTIAVSNRENDYITESRAAYLKNSKGRHIDPKSEKSILGTSIYSGNFKWEDNQYVVNGKKYTIAEARAAMDEISSPDISEDIFNGVKNNTKEAFKGALNNLQAESVIKDFKRNLDPKNNSGKGFNKQNLINAEQFYIGQNPGISIGNLRSQYPDENEYADFMSSQVNNYLTSQKNQHYTPPEAPEVEEEDEPEGDTPYFIAQKDMLDKITSSLVGPKTFGGKAGSPGIEYYQTAEFENMLPPALKLVKDGNLVQIQDATNTNINHTINPEQSLEYNINKLVPLLRSKKR